MIRCTLCGLPLKQQEPAGKMVLGRNGAVYFLKSGSGPLVHDARFGGRSTRHRPVPQEEP